MTHVQPAPFVRIDQHDASRDDYRRRYRLQHVVQYFNARASQPRYYGVAVLDSLSDETVTVFWFGDYQGHAMDRRKAAQADATSLLEAANQFHVQRMLPIIDEHIKLDFRRANNMPLILASRWRYLANHDGTIDVIDRIGQFVLTLPVEAAIVPLMRYHTIAVSEQLRARGIKLSSVS